MTAKCKKCGADVVIVKTKKGESIPCDFPPVDIVIDEKGKSVYVTVIGMVHGRRCTNWDYPVQAYVPHGVTCPEK